MFGACALGVMIANMRSGAMRKLERVITGSETAVASIFFLLAGAMVNPIVAWWPWIIAALVLAFRVVFKVPTTRLFSGNTWIERGADSIHFATIRQAPIAIPLAIASLLERTDNVQSTMLLVVATVGVFSNVIPLLWKRQP
jgi:Kef-type K+ transport system membrane component KefB